MAGEIIVTVTAVTGEVLIQTESGPKQLQVGDQLVLGSEIATGPGASVELVTADGETIVVAPMTMFAVTGDLVPETAADIPESAVGAESEQVILDALAAGEDLDQILDEAAPAAGGAGEGSAQEGHGIVILGRIGQEYRNFGIEFPETSEEVTTEEDASLIFNRPPEASSIDPQEDFDADDVNLDISSAFTDPDGDTD